jgi:hypothetical protein
VSTVEHLRRLREHFTPEQAEVILTVIESQSVTRDYLDARLATVQASIDTRFAAVDTKLEAMEKRLILWGIGLTGVIVTLVTTLDRVIPR